MKKLYARFKEWYEFQCRWFWNTAKYELGFTDVTADQAKSVRANQVVK